MLKLAIIVLDGCWGAQLMGVLDFVAIQALVAARHGLSPGIETQLYGMAGGEVRLGNGSPLTVAALPEQADASTLTLVPGIEYSRLKPILDHPSHDWVRLEHFLGQSGALLSLSTGAFILAHAGLLNGRQVVTHWRFSDTLQRRYPQLVVSRHHDLLDYGQVASAASLGGALAWLVQRLQVCLPSHLVSQGLALASLQGEQAASLWLTDSYCYKQHTDTAILKLQQFIDMHYAEPITLAALSTLMGGSESSLKRRFKRACGISVSRYWQLIRMARMKYLLLNSDAPVDHLCYDIGYADPRFARRLFVQSVGMTPREFRQQGLHFSKRQ